jgi:hypothetical protein
MFIIPFQACINTCSFHASFNQLDRAKQLAS